MKRHVIAGTIASALLLTVLSGCGPKGPAPSGSSSSVTDQVGTPSLGAVAIAGFVPRRAVAFNDSLAGLGETADGIPAVADPLGGTKWRVTNVGTTKADIEGAAQVGSTRVVVGESATSSPGGVQIPFAAISDAGAPYQVQQFTKVFGGRSARFAGIALSGDLTDPSSVLVAVGSMQATNGKPIGTEGATDPFAMVSADKGRTWTQFQTLPLPAGVRGAVATAIAYSPHSTPFPGVLAVGYGWATPQGGLPHTVAMLWGSRDGGKTWKVVIDPKYVKSGTNFIPTAVAADSDRVMILGTAAPANVKSMPYVAPTQMVLWVTDLAGNWNFHDKIVPSGGGSTQPTAVATHQSGGFIFAVQIAPTPLASAGTWPALPADASSKVTALYSIDGFRIQVMPSAPDLSAASRIFGAAEFGSRVALFGLDKSGVSKVWVSDATGGN